MAEKTPTQSDKDQARIKRLMKQDLEATTNTADLLAGKKTLPTKLNKKSGSPSIDAPSNLPKFLNFMERSYNSGSLIKVELKKKV